MPALFIIAKAATVAASTHAVQLSRKAPVSRVYHQYNSMIKITMSLLNILSNQNPIISILTIK